jgi:hypothetical protein
VAWTNSKIFQQAMLNPIGRSVNAATVPTSFVSLTADAVKVALFSNSTVPDNTAAVGSTGFNTGTWTQNVGNEVIDTGGSNWPTGGIAATGLTWALDTGSSSLCYHAANTPGLGNVTVAAAFGALVYDSTISGGTVAKQGLCYNYFGGTQNVTAGTFTVIWATVGATTAIFNVTV